MTENEILHESGDNGSDFVAKKFVTNTRIPEAHYSGFVTLSSSEDAKTCAEQNAELQGHVIKNKKATFLNGYRIPKLSDSSKENDQNKKKKEEIKYKQNEKIISLNDVKKPDLLTLKRSLKDQNQDPKRSKIVTKRDDLEKDRIIKSKSNRNDKERSNGKEYLDSEERKQQEILNSTKLKFVAKKFVTNTRIPEAHYSGFVTLSSSEDAKTCVEQNAELQMHAIKNKKATFLNSYRIPKLSNTSKENDQNKKKKEEIKYKQEAKIISLNDVKKPDLLTLKRCSSKDQNQNPKRSKILTESDDLEKDRIIKSKSNIRDKERSNGKEYLDSEKRKQQEILHLTKPKPSTDYLQALPFSSNITSSRHYYEQHSSDSHCWRQ